MTSNKINPSFRILSAFAIIFVVAGHADFGVFDIAGMFPYYSFHVGVFALPISFHKEQRTNLDNKIRALIFCTADIILPELGNRHPNQ